MCVCVCYFHCSLYYLSLKPLNSWIVKKLVKLWFHIRKVQGGCNLLCSPAAGPSRAGPNRAGLMAVCPCSVCGWRPRCARSCKAGYKGSVGIVGPSATGSDWGHGCLTGFTPLLLNKHTEPSDWSGGASNQGAADPLRTTAAGSASTRSFIGSPARLFYMNQRANYAFVPVFPLLGFVTSHKDGTEHEPVAEPTAVTTAHNFSESFMLCLHLWGSFLNRFKEDRIKGSV